MRFKLYFIAAILFLCIGNLYSKQYSYSVPRIMDLQVTDKSKRFEMSEFYPIGYSHGRYFAYATFSEKPQVYFILYIQDLVTDKIVEEWHYIDNPQPEQGIGPAGRNDL